MPGPSKATVPAVDPLITVKEALSEKVDIAVEKTYDSESSKTIDWLSKFGSESDSTFNIDKISEAALLLHAEVQKDTTLDKIDEEALVAFDNFFALAGEIDKANNYKGTCEILDKTAVNIGAESSKLKLSANFVKAANELSTFFSKSSANSVKKVPDLFKAVEEEAVKAKVDVTKSTAEEIFKIANSSVDEADKAVKAAEAEKAKAVAKAEVTKAAKDTADKAKADAEVDATTKKKDEAEALKPTGSSPGSLPDATAKANYEKKKTESDTAQKLFDIKKRDAEKAEKDFQDATKTQAAAETAFNDATTLAKTAKTAATAAEAAKVILLKELESPDPTAFPDLATDDFQKKVDDAVSNADDSITKALADAARKQAIKSMIKNKEDAYKKLKDALTKLDELLLKVSDFKAIVENNASPGGYVNRFDTIVNKTWQIRFIFTELKSRALIKQYRKALDEIKGKIVTVTNDGKKKLEDLNKLQSPPAQTNVKKEIKGGAPETDAISTDMVTAYKDIRDEINKFQDSLPELRKAEDGWSTYARSNYADVKQHANLVQNPPAASTVSDIIKQFDELIEESKKKVPADIEEHIKWAKDDVLKPSPKGSSSQKSNTENQEPDGENNPTPRAPPASSGVRASVASSASANVPAKSPAMAAAKLDTLIDDSNKDEDRNVGEKLDKAIHVVMIFAVYVFSAVVFGSILYKMNKDLDYKRSLYTDNTNDLSFELNRLSNMISDLCTLREGSHDDIVAIIHEYAKSSATNLYSFTDDATSMQYSYDQTLEMCLRRKKTEFYYQLNKVINMYRRENFFQLDDMRVPFPWTEAIMNGVMLMVCILTLSIVYMNFSPYLLADQINELRSCEAAVDECVNVDDKDKAKCEAGQQAKLKKCKLNAEPSTITQEIIKISILMAVITSTIYMCSVVLTSTINYGSSLENISHQLG